MKDLKDIKLLRNDNNHELPFKAMLKVTAQPRVYDLLNSSMSQLKQFFSAGPEFETTFSVFSKEYMRTLSEAVAKTAAQETDQKLQKYDLSVRIMSAAQEQLERGSDVSITLDDVRIHFPNIVISGWVVELEDGRSECFRRFVDLLDFLVVQPKYERK